MSVGTGDGQFYNSEFDRLAAQFQPAKDDAGSYHAGRDEEQKLNIDNDHHVPLVASAIMDEQGHMTGMAIDHRVKVPDEHKPFLYLHEATELPLMHDYITDGMSEQDAYHKAHDIATQTETAAVRAYAIRNGHDPDEYHEQYKQFFRDAAAVAREPSNVPRHELAHTTVHKLDEAELGNKFQGMTVPGGQSFEKGLEDAKKREQLYDKMRTNINPDMDQRYQDDISGREHYRLMRKGQPDIKELKFEEQRQEQQLKHTGPAEWLHGKPDAKPKSI